MTVYVEPQYILESIQTVLLETFINVYMSNGRRGFFHPDHFTPGQSISLSEVMATAYTVPGVSYVVFNRFHRWGSHPRDELTEGIIEMGSIEVVRVDNDRNAPENGIIEFNMKYDDGRPICTL